MLRVLRRSGSPTVLRRLLAFVLGVVLLAGCVEPALADACDGDAPRDIARAVLPHVDGAPAKAAAGVSGPTVADAPARSVGTDGVATDDVATADATGGRSSGDRAPEHAVHVCHCTHAHGATLTDRYALETRTRPVARAVDVRSDRLPPSPALEPHLRPPVLPHAA